MTKEQEQDQKADIRRMRKLEVSELNGLFTGLKYAKDIDERDDLIQTLAGRVAGLVEIAYGGVVTAEMLTSPQAAADEIRGVMEYDAEKQFKHGE